MREKLVELMYKKFCWAITLSANKLLDIRYLPTQFQRSPWQKLASGKSLACPIFIAQYNRPTVKVPSTILEATLSGDSLQFLYSIFKCHFNNYFITRQ